MCLIVDHQKTAETKQNTQDEFVTRYKVVRVNGKQITSLYYCDYVWQEGENIARNLEVPHPHYIHADYIHAGIHVYVTELVAERLAAWYQSRDSTTTYAVMPVKCYIKDLIAVSRLEAYQEHVLVAQERTEAYTKVYVDKLP